MAPLFPLSSWLRRISAWGLALGLLGCGLADPSGGPTESWPRLMVWAWERPEDLSFLPSEGSGVAYLAASVTLSGAATTVVPRRQPLSVPHGAVLLPVLRIEVDPRRPTELTASRAAAVAELGVGLVEPGHLGLQVDFDATVSQRTFYGWILTALRERLPPEQGLSVAGLASWCQPDSWLRAYPIDEFVPMLYRMGPDGVAIRQRVAAGRALPDPLCGGAVGLSADEPPPRLPRVGRLYLFHPEAWTPLTFQAFADGLLEGR